MATVRVRMFAGLRDAAGAEWHDAEAADVDQLLALLSQRHGDRFTRYLQRTKVIVGSDQVETGVAHPLDDGDEVVLLPPFAGG